MNVIFFCYWWWQYNCIVTVFYCSTNRHRLKEWPARRKLKESREYWTRCEPLCPAANWPEWTGKFSSSFSNSWVWTETCRERVSEMTLFVPCSISISTVSTICSKSFQQFNFRKKNLENNNNSILINDSTTNIETNWYFEIEIEKQKLRKKEREKKMRKTKFVYYLS